MCITSSSFARSVESANTGDAPSAFSRASRKRNVRPSSPLEYTATFTRRFRGASCPCMAGTATEARVTSARKKETRRFKVPNESSSADGRSAAAPVRCNVMLCRRILTRQTEHDNCPGDRAECEREDSKRRRYPLIHRLPMNHVAGEENQREHRPGWNLSLI